jgi:hypothetical protein
LPKTELTRFISQNFSGLSVVDGPSWLTWKKYNVNEVYKAAGAASAPNEAKAEPKADTGDVEKNAS